METHTFMSHSEFNLTICILSLFNCRQLLYKQLSEITELKKESVCVSVSQSSSASTNDVLACASQPHSHSQGWRLLMVLAPQATPVK